MNKTKKLTFAAMCLALGVILPQAFHMIPNAGNIFLPMHIPVLICGFICGPFYGLAVGIITPCLSHIIFSMPPAMMLGQMIVELEKIKKVSQGSPNIKEAILNKEIDLIINTSEGKQSAQDGYVIRRLAIELGIPYVTTLAGARAALNAIAAVQNNKISVKSLNEYIEEL